MADTKAKSKLSKVFVWLIAPMAIGIYLAIAFLFIAKSFYQTRSYPTDSRFAQALQSLDQKSVDARFNLRGQRAGDPRVAILAIDDRSLDIVGRWPWPRGTLARALDNTFKAGAKVIAADVVWSEESDRPETRLVEKLRNETKLTPDLNARLEKSLDETDNDKLMGQFIEAHKENFVMGGFFTTGDTNEPNPIADACYDAIYEGSRLSKVLNSQTKPLVVISENEISFPKEFTDIYANALGQIETDIKGATPPPKTKIETYQLDEKVTMAKLDFCERRFLDPSQDEAAARLKENWAQIKSVVAGLTASSFDEWYSVYQNNSLENLVSNARIWNTNVPVIQDHGHNTGYFNAALDTDGTIRSTMLIARTGSRFMPSIALQSYLTATDTQTDIKIGPLAKMDGYRGVKEFGISNSDGDTLFKIPADPYGKIMINYAGKPFMFAHASIADLLDETRSDVNVRQRVWVQEALEKMANSSWIKKKLRQLADGLGLKYGEWEERTITVPKTDFFKDKILVLGATAIGVFDMRNTPFDGNYPGVETHANVIDNLLRKDFLRHDEREDVFMPWILLALGIILAVTLARFGAFSGLLITAFVLGATIFIDHTFLFGKGIVVSIAFPVIQVFAMYLVLTFYKYLTEERSKKELRGTFSKYVSPAIVNEVLKDPKNLELGGRKERITVFFSDVRGFTTISEKLDPRALSDLLNSYLTPMTDLVFKNKGTLDKYMGDAVMAFFGAPISYPDHAKYACRCALESLVKLKELQAEYERKGLPMIDIGIGLNTGECSVGNMGSQTVRNYTVMGDAVNLASRLEGINKTYGTRIIISENTYGDVKDDFSVREVDWVRVKGKLQPVKIFELLGEGKAAGNVIEMAKYFGEGYHMYHDKKFDGAIRSFQQAIGQNPADETSKIYIERCQEFIVEPPPENWDGVYVMKTK